MALPNARPVRAPRGTEISAKSWQTEAPMRMLMNNLDMKTLVRQAVPLQSREVHGGADIHPLLLGRRD